MKKTLMQKPSPYDGAVQIADYAELMTFQSGGGKVSKQDLISAMNISDEGNQDQFESVVEEAFTELDDRQKHMGDGIKYYPFKLERKGALLCLNKRLASDEKGLLYLFLLLATRMNMNNEKVQDEKDGTKLFEHLCVEAAKNYWGGSSDHKVHGEVFGTGRTGGKKGPSKKNGQKVYPELINALCLKLGEGACFQPPEGSYGNPKDDKLDVVVWRNFSDGRHGKLIGFGQCKTGTNWEEDLPKLNPNTFCHKWLRDAPAVAPVKLFFLTDRVREKWYTRVYEASLLFDRCRILDYLGAIQPAILADCAAWTRAALKSWGLN